MTSKIHAIRRQGYELLHHGAIELARVEHNGIFINVDLLESTRRELESKMRKLEKALREDDVWKIWRKRYGSAASLTSRDQLSYVLYQALSFQVTTTTDAGKPATDEEALQKIDHPFVSQLVRYLKYEKALGTFLKGIEREVAFDRLHPFFNLHTARTYRSSSDSPNFQNQPVRDKEISEIIRRHFGPSPGCVLIENDFKGIEVALSASYHKDQNFISYITTPGKDMHRDMAAQIYCIDPKDVSKDARYGAKNKFVFPQFYGDWYLTCAKSLWDWAIKGKILGPGGVPILEHMAHLGIHELGDCDPDSEPCPGTFECHIKEVEDDFWNNRFRDYGQWRKDWYRQYLDRGYFDMLTGFRVYGSFNRNSVTNYPIQGSAFHCLLWSLICVNRQIRKYRMKAKVVGQIHDSLIGDVPINELRDYLDIVEQVTTEWLPKHYPWLVVPPEIEYEIVLPGDNWFQKQEFRFKKGRFLHPADPQKTTRDAEKFLAALKMKAAK